MRGVPAALGGRKGLRLQGFAALKRYGKFLLMREKEKNMRQIHTVALIGLGAMGAYFAPRLYEEFGDNFRVIAGGDRKKRLEENGIVINGTRRYFPVVDPKECGEPADLVIIAVKGYGLDQAIEDIRNQVGENTVILSVLNGVDSEQRVIEAYGEDKVLYSYMRVSVVMKDGCTSYDPALGNIHFGEKLNEEGAYTDRVLAVKEVFDRCGITNIIDPDMIKGIWFKFMCNVGENLTCALLGIPFGVFRTSDHANAIRRKAMEEVVLIAQELGVDLGKEDMDRQESTLMALPFQNKPSTLQDLEAGKWTEIDMFAGTVIEYGRKLGIATPVNEMFYHAIHVLEEKCGGSFQAAD